MRVIATYRSRLHWRRELSGSIGRHWIGELLTVDRMRWTAERAAAVWYFANVANGATFDLYRRFRFVEVTRDFTFPNAPLAPSTGVLLRATLTTGR